MTGRYQTSLSPSSVGTQTCSFNFGPGEIRGFYVLMWGPYPSYGISTSHLSKTFFRLSVQNAIGLAQGYLILNVFPNTSNSGYAFGAGEFYFDRPVVLTETHVVVLSLWENNVMVYFARSNEVVEGFTVGIGTSLLVGDHA